MRNCEVNSHNHVSVVCSTLPLHCDPSVNPAAHSREEPWPLQAVSVGYPVSSWRQLTSDKPQSLASTSPACCCLFSASQIQPTVIWNPLGSSAEIFALFLLPGPRWRRIFTQPSAPFRGIPLSTFKSRGKGGKLFKYILKMQDYALVQQEFPTLCISICAEKSSYLLPLLTTTSLYIVNFYKCCP